MFLQSEAERKVTVLHSGHGRRRRNEGMGRRLRSNAERKERVQPRAIRMLTLQRMSRI